MEVIQKLSGKSYGGIKCNKFELLPIEWAASVPDIGAGAHLGEITLVEGKNWTEINCRRDSILFDENEVIEQGTKHYDAKLNFLVARDSADTVKKMQRMGRRGFLVRFTDRNGNKTLMGAVKFPARLTWSRSKKNRRPETNEIEAMLRCVNRLPAAYYNY